MANVGHRLFINRLYMSMLVGSTSKQISVKLLKSGAIISTTIQAQAFLRTHLSCT